MKTDFDVIMRNAEAFIKSGGRNRLGLIVFEHNEHQVEEANELSKKWVLNLFMTKISTRGFNLSNNTSKKYNVKFNKKEKIGKISMLKDEKVSYVIKTWSH